MPAARDAGSSMVRTSYVCRPRSVACRVRRTRPNSPILSAPFAPASFLLVNSRAHARRFRRTSPPIWVGHGRRRRRRLYGRRLWDLGFDQVCRNDRRQIPARSSRSVRCVVSGGDSAFEVDSAATPEPGWRIHGDNHEAHASRQAPLQVGHTEVNCAGVTRRVMARHSGAEHFRVTLSASH